MKILMVYPEYPETFWSFRHALKFISKKAVHPPLGLLTVAAMLPQPWEKRLVDLNVEKLNEMDIEWADYVLISAMAVQRRSAEDIIRRCNAKNRKIVAGGPLFTVSHDDFPSIDHFVLGEAEIALPLFLDDLGCGRQKRIYKADSFPDIEKTPPPLWNLINMKKYLSMNIQYSRGCPFNCDFCDITALFGRGVRTKSKEQVIYELDSLYSIGWKGNVFFVDDNFIGNKAKLKSEILPAIAMWMKKRKKPFVFSTEASINLSDDSELMQMMVGAGFESVFIGIETPSEECLAECGKHQNKSRDLLSCVKNIQNHGLEVSAGFIVGFDSDSSSVFQRQIDFIQKSGIVTAMVGLLNAPKNTRLYQRLKSENRLLKEHTGNNTDFSMNFIPKMEYPKLIEGYKNIIDGIYSYKPYYKRVKSFLRDYRTVKKKRFCMGDLKAFFKSVFVLGIKDSGRLYYWNLFFWSLLRKPKNFPLAITFAIYGFHFRKVLGISS